MTVDADREGGLSDPFHGDIHMSPVIGDDSGANSGVPHHVPPHTVANEPAPSAEEKHSAVTNLEDRQCPDPDPQTSPVVGDETGGECNVGAGIEEPPVADDAAADAEGTQSAGPVHEGGDPSHAAKMHTSAEVQDDGTGKFKVGDEGPSEAVADEDATPRRGQGVLLPFRQKVT